MTLFTVGPVEMHPDTLDVAGKQLPYFRTEQFSQINLESERILKKLAGASENDKVAFLTASGTGAMEAAIINAFDEKDRMLIVNGGSFGHRFCEICDVHGIPYDEIKLEFGEELTESHISEYDGKEYSALLVNIHETSTGQLYDIDMLSAFCRKNGMYLIVDAISSFLADDISFNRDGMDIMIISSQKALSLSPGLSAVIMSSRIFDERISVRKSVCLYLDLKSHIKNGERGQTPFTPAVGILLELNSRLKILEAKGIDRIISETAERAEYFRKIVKDLPVDIPEFRHSNAVTPIVVRNGNAHGIFEQLMSEGMVVTPSGGDLRDKVLRISHIGNLKLEDYDKLKNHLERVLS